MTNQVQSVPHSLGRWTDWINGRVKAGGLRVSEYAGNHMRLNEVIRGDSILHTNDCHYAHPGPSGLHPGKGSKGSTHPTGN